MEAADTAASPDMSLRRFLSSFVRKSTRQPRRSRRSSYSEANKSHEVEFPNKNRLSDAGYWGNELSADSFLELSSEVVPNDAETYLSNSDSPIEDPHVGVNGNLWKDEVRRKCSELTSSLEETLRTGSPNQNGLSLKFPPDLPERIARKIVGTASSEPCGLRGCCVNLRLLHEDIADVLMTSQDKDHTIVAGRSEKCASWPDAPADAGNVARRAPQRPPLNFTNLPDMDASLTESLCSDLSTDSGFSDQSNNTSGRRKRLQHSSSVPVLPNLSAASRLHVACADVGRLDLCDPSSVPTFQIYVYLAPATSWTWRLRKLFFSSLKLGNSTDQDASSKTRRALTVTPDFTIVKKKLYRTHSNALEVMRCPPQ